MIYIITTDLTPHFPNSHQARLHQIAPKINLVWKKPITKTHPNFGIGKLPLLFF